MRDRLDDILNEIGNNMDDDSSIEFDDCVIWKGWDEEFVVQNEPMHSSYWEPCSPKFSTFIGALHWLAVERENGGLFKRKINSPVEIG